MLDRTAGRRRNRRFDPIVQVIFVGVATLVATLVGAQIVLASFVRSADEAVFERLVPPLQEIEWLVNASQVLTDVGAKNVAYGAALVLIAALLVVERSLRQSLVVVVTLVVIHGLQWLTFATARGVIPTEHVIGTAGPYYSGGVVRALVVSGMIAFALATRCSIDDRRLIWGVPLTIGLVEAGTRLVLGRHWPLDAVVALPIGISLLWCYQRAAEWIERPRLATPLHRR